MGEEEVKFECNCCTTVFKDDNLKNFCTNNKCKWKMCNQCHDKWFFKGLNNNCPHCNKKIYNNNKEKTIIITYNHERLGNILFSLLILKVCIFINIFIIPIIYFIDKNILFNEIYIILSFIFPLFLIFIILSFNKSIIINEVISEIGIYFI